MMIEIAIFLLKDILDSEGEAKYKRARMTNKGKTGYHFEGDAMNFLQNFPEFIRIALLPGNDVLREAFEKEFAETILPRIKLGTGDGVKYDLNKNNRKPDLGAMIVLAALLEDQSLCERLLKYRSQVSFDHYSIQRSAGVSREDAGRPDSDNTSLMILCDAGIEYLRKAGAKSNIVTQIEKTINWFMSQLREEEEGNSCG